MRKTCASAAAGASTDQALSPPKSARTLRDLLNEIHAPEHGVFKLNI
jgi:hypothetical protein